MPPNSHAARRLALFLRAQAAAIASPAAPPSRPVAVTVRGLGSPLVAPRATFRPTDALRALRDGGAVSVSDADDPIVAARVHGTVVALGEPLNDLLETAADEVSLEWLRFSSHDGARLFWHSAAHVCGAALEAHFGDAARLSDGPSFSEGEGGFFYELSLADGGRVEPGAFPALEAAARALVAARAPFERLQVTRELAADLFSENPLKLDLLSRIPAGETLTVFRCGNFVDLCRGPHVAHTGVFKALTFTRVGASHGADGVSGGNLLQRVYGYAAPTPRALAAWSARIEEARRRDHRVIGKAQELFFFHESSPGSAFMLPHGTRVLNRLTELLRWEYRQRGYEEVSTPLLFKKELWATSGHLDAYAENMFSVRGGGLVAESGCAAHTHASLATGGTADGGDGAASSGNADIFGLKPMNCPGHCLVFAHKLVTYRDLPLRVADFSPLHRNEASGALGGLTRLRRFAQDDAHIFCSEAQVEAEVRDVLDFIACVYALFGFSFRAVLSTRPERFVGDEATWARAEVALGAALRSFLAAHDGGAGAAAELVIDHGGGAFYGPKVDVFVRDAIGREHQCATVQLDFQLPRRFGLVYRGPGAGDGAGDGADLRTPVLIHRAILGSLERMMAILIEHTAGKWPFWLSPRQILLVTVAERHAPYAARVAALLRGDAARDSGLWVDVDASPRTVPKKVREAQVGAHNLIVVLGDSEEAANTASVRFRDVQSYNDFRTAWAVVDSTAAASASPSLPPSSAEAPNFASPLLTMSLPALLSVCTEMRNVKLTSRGGATGGSEK